MCWQEHDFLAWLNDTLLNSTSEHVTNTLDLVNARDWHAHWCTHRTLRHAAHFVQNIVHSIHMNGFLADRDIEAFPPIHILRLFQEVVTHPSRYWHVGCILFHEVFLPSNLY